MKSLIALFVLTVFAANASAMVTIDYVTVGGLQHGCRQIQ